MKSPTTATYALILVSSSLSRSSVAFAPLSPSISHSKAILSQQKYSKQLNSHAVDTDDEAMRIMMAANNCIDSETCSIEEAEQYLNDVLHLQSDCVSGALHNDLVCEDVVFPTQVIAGLREKIAKQVEIGNQTKSPFKIGLNPIFLAVLAMYVSTGIISLAHNNPDAFTAQEWMYALQGGYLDDMLSAYMKYGGLAPVLETTTTSDSSSVAIVPLTLQELGWSVRDGYVGTFLSEYQKYGGFLTFMDSVGSSSSSVVCDGMGSAAEDFILTTPFTTQEWMNAAKDGYLSEMMQHYIRNGGL